MTKSKIPLKRNRYNYNWKQFAGEKNEGKSMTIQGEAYTIQELMERAVVSGQLMAETRIPTYMDPEDLDKINHFYSKNIDLTDMDELRRQTEDMAHTIKKAQEKAQHEHNEHLAEQSRLKALSQEPKDDESSKSTISKNSDDKGPS